MSASSTLGLPQRIQTLLEERQQHADAIVAIDALLDGIGSVLGVSTKKRGRPPMKTMAVAPAVAGTKKKRTRRKFAISGEQSILGFIKSNRNPTSQEIEKHWKSEGRSFVAANLLSKLVKEKTLKRAPLGKGIRGSRYSLA